MTQYDYVLQLCLLSFVTSLVILLTRCALRRKKYAGEEHERILERRLTEFEPRPLIEEDAYSRSFRETPTPATLDDQNDCFDLAKVDYLSLASNKTVLDSAADCIRTYSVGTCGPRGFFGTIDVHLELEDRLAKLLKAECGIVYSYGFLTTSSCIHCYCKRNTIVFIDEHANYAIKMGVETAGSCKVIFKHNDAADFASKAKQFGSATANLRVLVTEGICSYDGSICPFPQFLAVCKEHKLRVLLDESISFGVLGDQGQGITEYFGVNINEIDVVMGSLEYALAGYGGFCVGTSMAIHPQRLTSVGFVFSASLPTFCAQAAITTLDLIGDRPKTLRALSLQVHDFLRSLPELCVKSDRESPLKVFSVRDDVDGVLVERLHRNLADNRVHVLRGEDGGLLKMNLFVDLIQPERLEEFFRVVGEVVKTSLRDGVEEEASQ